MKHYIIVKYTEEVKDKEAMLGRVSGLFSRASMIPGVLGAQVFPNCVDRENRYDLMIVVEMEKDALNTWDDSELHHEWKEKYGAFIAKKTIFDREE